MNNSIGVATRIGGEPTGDVTQGLNLLASRIGQLSEHVRELEARIGGVLTPDAPPPTAADPRGNPAVPTPPSSSVTFEVRRLCEQVDGINAHLGSITRRVDL